MGNAATFFFGAFAVGVGATLFMDLWALLLKLTLNVQQSNYCLVGRWVCHMAEGTFRHASIVAAAPKRFECAVGWIAHYVLGVIYALVLAAFTSASWLVRPTFWPAILFAVGSLMVPFLIMQPAFGLGIAAAKTPDPNQARLRSLMAHVAFGVGLYVCAVAVSYVLPVYAST